MKNILKRNQIIIFVIALMLVSAGYLSYTENKTENTLTTSTQTIEEDIGEQYAGIGDAKLVSSNDIIQGNEQIAIVSNQEEASTTNTSIENNNQTSALVENEEENKHNEELTDNEKEPITTSTSTNNTKSKETQEYYSASRLNRETMYSQMIESYQKILESETINETQKAIAQTEIQNINSTKNKIMICENLIKTKGIEDLIIFVNDKSISVVVRADTLEQEQIAQIQNIIQREMDAEISNIHISNK